MRFAVKKILFSTLFTANLTLFFDQTSTEVRSFIPSWKNFSDLFRLWPPSSLCSPQWQSTCHYIVNHYVKILHVRLGVANIMHPLSWGGHKRKRSDFSNRFNNGQKLARSDRCLQKKEQKLYIFDQISSHSVVLSPLSLLKWAQNISHYGNWD